MQKQIVKQTMAKKVEQNMRIKPITTLRIVDAGDVKTGKGTRGVNGPKYRKYDSAIAPHVLWLQQTIAATKDGIIRIRNKDIAQTMGGEFVKKHATSIYWGLKYVLFNHDIVVDSGTNIKGDKLLVLRARKDGDKLPASLDKLTKTDAKTNDKKSETPKTDVPKEVPKVDKIVKTPMPRRLITAIRLPSEAVVTADLPTPIEGEIVQA